ncbi:MAG: hypothetical protein ACTS8S_16525 [Giesbergeria sp.]
MNAQRWKLPAIIAAVILIGGTLAGILWIGANKLEGTPGFFGPAPLIADINLSLEILLVAGLTVGLVLARRGNIDAHKYNQTTWVLLNIVLVAFIMAGSMQDVKPAKLADLSDARIAITWLHALAGSFTVAGGLWIVLQMNAILPQSWRIRWWKNLMRATLAGYWVVALGGFVTYYFWYVG